MIEIIKHGTKKRCTCRECGCVFSYDYDEDVIKTGIEPTEEPDIYCYKEKLHCPQCKTEIILAQMNTR